MLLRRLRLAALALLVLPVAVVAVTVVTASPAAANTCTKRTSGDINGDGISDALVGQPSRGVVGAVSVIYGNTTVDGLTATGSQFITLSGLGLSRPSSMSGFGLQAKLGFFNADCYADAVIGEEDWDTGSLGAIVVIYGSSAGLNLATAVRFTAAQIHADADQIGTTLAVGNFNKDAYDDVAIGAYGTGGNEGGVAIMDGSSSGLTLTGRQWFDENSTDVPGTAAPQADFGWALASGDFNADGYADLAVGVPGDDVTRSALAGDVIVLYGSGSGLTGATSTIFSEDTPDVPGTAEDSDAFGSALAIGDVTGDGIADLIVGVPGEKDGVAEGAVFLLPGSRQGSRQPGGVTATGSQYRDQSSSGFPASPLLVGYGSTVTVADFNNDGEADIASGAGDTVVDGAEGAGAFAVLYGVPGGLSTSRSAILTQASANIVGTPQALDLLGVGLQTLPVTFSGYPGLIVAAPGETKGTLTASTEFNGGIEILRGGGSGVTGTGSTYMDGSDLAGGIAGHSWMGYDQPGNPDYGDGDE
ncbi:MAG TPA: hypothetical protein VGF84_07570 [Micromonosporaceae bacterium]